MSKDLRYLICAATGDQAELAEFFVLSIDSFFLHRVSKLMEGGKNIDKASIGSIDITERGTVEFYVAYDFPDPDHSPLFDQIDAWDWAKEPMLLPDKLFEFSSFGEFGKVRKTECHGFQVWPDTGHVRLTCYPREESYRIESSISIDQILYELKKNFAYEQPK